MSNNTRLLVIVYSNIITFYKVQPLKKPFNFIINYNIATMKVVGLKASFFFAFHCCDGECRQAWPFLAEVENYFAKLLFLVM